MGSTPKPILNIETLNALALRLADHAQDVLARKDVAHDLLVAAQACNKLASLRFRIAEIADVIAMADVAPSAVRDLRKALDDTAQC